MDIRLLIEQQNSIALTLISPLLYELTDDESIAFFHDEERSDLFFIHLNEYLNSRFNSPLDNDKQVSVFELLIDVCYLYQGNESFDNLKREADRVSDFFFKKRYYRYYLPPYTVDIDLSLAELINFQANISKHSFYHLTIIKKKLRQIFEANNIENAPHEDYNEHLRYFKEAVLEDRLNFNQTKMLELLGNFFLAYWDLINSNDNLRIKSAISDFVKKNGRTAIRNIDKPEHMTEVEKFHWEIKSLNFSKRERLEKYIPQTNQFLIERSTNPDKRIDKSSSLL